MLVRHQAIAGANNDGVHTCMHARLSLNVLMVIFQVMLAGHTVNIPGASFTLTLERRPLYYLLNIIIPSLVLAALSALSFAVPVDSGEKLSFSMSILVAFSVFMLILQENTPEADSPLLGKYTLKARFMGPTWGRQDPDGPHVCPMNLAKWAEFVDRVHFRLFHVVVTPPSSGSLSYFYLGKSYPTRNAQCWSLNATLR